MNLTKLFKTLLALLFLVGMVNAQTFYVNNAWGNDANSGTGPGVGQAKFSVSSALYAAPSGSTISVAFTGINYTEVTPGMNILPGPVTPGVTGTYTFVSSGGTPVFTNPFQVGTAATPGAVTFTGAFQFNGLNLVNGTLAGGNQVTITSGALVYRTELGSITSGQLAFAGVADFQYEVVATAPVLPATAIVMTTGLDFPVATNVARNFTSTATFANLTTRLDQNRQINGVLTLGAGANLGGMDLNTFTLTIAGNNAHTTDGNITGGTLAFTATAAGAASIEGVAPGVYTLPNITATATTAAWTLTVCPGGALIGAIGNIAASNVANITCNNTGNIGSVTLNGSGTITTNNGTGTVGVVLAAVGSSGTITLNRAAAGAQTSTSITQSGTGIINWGVVPTSVVTGAVLVNSAITLPLAPAAALTNVGVIWFTQNVPTTTGTVTVSSTFSGATDRANAGNGAVQFNSSTTTVNTGAILNNSSGTWTVSAAPGALTNSGSVYFAATTGNLTLGNVTNSSSLPGSPTTGNIQAFAAGTASVTTGAILNNSTVTQANIDFSNLTGGLTATSITSSGAGGGDILLGNGNVTVTNAIQNSRTVAGADIVVGTAATAGTNIAAASIINDGAALIDFVSFQTGTCGTVAAPINISQTGTGTTRFLNTTTGTFSMRNLTVSSGTLQFGNGTGQLSATGTVSLTAGTVDWGTGAAHNFIIGGGTGYQVYFGGVGTVCTMNNGNNLTIDLQQPIPNINQIVSLSTINQTFNGRLLVSNGAIIPAPYVIFQSADPANVAPGNLYILNLGGAADALTFSTPAPPANPQNTIQLNNARLYVGRNNPAPQGGGDFQNTSGYTTLNGGFVMMSANVPQRVNNTAAANAGATFGGFGVDNNAGSIAANADVAIINACTFTNEFYLAQGSVANTLVGWAATTNVVFNGPNPYPSIFRTEGVFRSAPTFNSYVNVTWYGYDKVASFEVPAAANRLWNLTVATTNGASAGKGIVTLVSGTTVNGALTINTDQSLYTAAQTLVINGATVSNSGYLVDDGGLRVQLAYTSGTALTGPGRYPSLQINNASNGNSISNVPGVISNGFGGDGVWGGGNDDFATTDGNITFAGGATASSLTASFIGAGPHFNNLTLANNGTFTLGANAVMAGNIALPAGTINLATFNLTHNGIAFAQTGATVLTGTGSLIFPTAATVMTGTLSGTAIPTIAANVIMNNAGGTVTLAGTNWRIDGNLTLGTATPTITSINNGGFDLTLGGASVTFYSTSGITGAGRTILLNTAPNTLLTWTVPNGATPTLSNLRVDGNVTLAGNGSGSLTVNGAASGFVMNSGTFTLNNNYLYIGTSGAPTATPFVYNAGTILMPNSGWLVWSSTATWTMNGALSLARLEADAALDITNANANALANNLTITDILYLNGVNLTQARTVAPTGAMLNMNASTTMWIGTNGNITIGGGQVVPNYAGLIDYYFITGNSTPNLFTWPALQANNVRLNMTANNNTVTLGASRTIAGDLWLQLGDLVWDNGVTLTMTDGKTIRRDDNGSILNWDANGDATTGGFVSNSVNLSYFNNSANINTGLEYTGTTSIPTFTLLGGNTAGNTTIVTIVNARTLAVTNLVMNSILNINAATTWTLAQTIPVGSTVNSNSNTTWSGGLTINGTYVNNATSSGTLTYAGTFTNNGIFNSTLISSTGTTNLNVGSTLNMTGDATLNNITVPVAPAVTTLNTGNNLSFTGTFTNAGLNLTFNGAADQVWGIPGNLAINNLIMNKTTDTKVTLSGGNVTLQNGAAPFGVLTLTRGVLKILDPFMITLNPTFVVAAPNILTGLGYVRNPINTVVLAHVNGKVGVAIVVNTIGRLEWPVGSDTRYRPAAITFTAGNATIAPTTIIVSHIEAAPITAGESRPEFPLDGGTKVLGGQNWIGSATPYYWLFEATTSLGASQRMDVELNGTDLPGVFPSLGNRNHNDLRIMSRFFGNVVANRYHIEGANNTYSNALYENTPVTGNFLAVVRNVGSLGSAIAQKAIFTIGLPTQAPIWTVAGNVAGAISEATAGVLNTYTTTQTAADPDVTNSAITYAVLSVTPAVPSDATYGITSAGVFSFKPGWNGGTNAGTAYTFVIQASKTGGDAVTKSIVVTVTNSNRLPSFAATGGVGLTNQSVPYNKEYSTVLNAVDPDGGTPVYAIQSVVPALVTAPAINALGKLSFTPVYADLGKAVVITVTATDADGGVATTAATFTVTAAYKRGDANLSGGEPDVTDAIQILEYVVGKRTFTDEQKSYANADLSVEVPTNPTAYDASFILRYIAANYVWPTSKAVATTGTVGFGKLAAQNGTFSLPFNLTNTKGVTSVYAEVTVGSNVDVNTINSRFPQDWLVVTNNENGIVKIAAAGVTPLSDGAFATLEMKLKDKEAVVALQGSAVLNDELSASLNAKVREIPSEFALSQNYPNPFNPTTTIKYAVAEDVKVSLVVYDMLGRVVKTLVDGQQEAGFYNMKWDGTNEYGSRVASGIYIYRLQAGSFTSTIKMNLMK